MADSKSSAVPHLVVAAGRGDEGEVGRLLDKSDVRQLLEMSTGIEKFTALHVAASAGYDSIVKRLVGAIRGLGVSRGEVEVLMNVRDCLGRTPLHHAAWMQHGNVTKTLLSYNEVTVNARDVNHFTPVHLLLLGWKGDVEALKPFLGRHDIKLDDKAIQSEDVRRFLNSIQVPNDSWRTEVPLPSLPDYVLHNWSRDPIRMQPIVATAESDRWDLVSKRAARKIVDDIEVMLRPIVDSNNEENLDMSSVMHLLAFLNLPEFMSMLARRPEFLHDINAENFAKQTPLHVASLRGNLEIVQFLNEQPTLRGAMEDALGQTPDEIAFEMGWDDIEWTLMQRQDVKENIRMQHANRSLYVDGTNAILVGATLIAGITFAGWLQPPLGYQQYHLPSDKPFEQYAAITGHPAVKIFWISNSLSFYFAIAAILGGAGVMLPPRSGGMMTRTDKLVRAEVRRLGFGLYFTSIAFSWAVAFVVMAFTAAGFAALPPILEYRLYMVVTAVVGFFLCICTHTMTHASHPGFIFKCFTYVDPVYYFPNYIPSIIMKYSCGRPLGYKSYEERIERRKRFYKS